MTEIRVFLRDLSFVWVCVFCIDEGVSFRGLWVKAEAFGGGIKTGHELPRVDDFRRWFRPGF